MCYDGSFNRINVHNQFLINDDNEQFKINRVINKKQYKIMPKNSLFENDFVIQCITSNVALKLAIQLDWRPGMMNLFYKRNLMLIIDLTSILPYL